MLFADCVTSLEQLESKLSEIIGESVKLVKDKKEGYFCVARDSYPKGDRRFWGIFHSKNDGDFFTLGDFADEEFRERIKTNFDTHHLTIPYKIPSFEKYNKKKVEFAKDVSIFFNSTGHNVYTDSYKKTPSSTGLYNKKLYMPFYRLKDYQNNCMLCAVLEIDETGKKMYVKGSEPRAAFHPVKRPAQSQDLLYLCEGLLTGYAIRECIKQGSGVFCVGSIGNMENVITALKPIYKNIVICTERASAKKYMELKYKHNLYLVGSDVHEDFHHFYMVTGKAISSKSLLAFREKHFIPLGIKGGRLCCYMRSTGGIQYYTKNNVFDLFSDTYDTDETPGRKEASDLYFKVKKMCRANGNVKTIKVIKEGVTPYKDNMYYYDLERLYHIKKNKVIQTDIDPILNTDFLLEADAKVEQIDLGTVKSFSLEEIKKVASVFDVFNLPAIERKFLFAWVIQSNICGGLKYRAPLWILGHTGAGKTQLTSRIIKKFFIFYQRKQGRLTTPRWLYREFNGKAIPLQRDEYEHQRGHSLDTLHEMEVVRAVATERFPERAISAGTDDATQEFTYCFSPMYTGIRRPNELGLADMARFVFITLKGEFADNYDKVVPAFERFMTPINKARFLKTCLERMHKVNQFYDYQITHSKGIIGHGKSSLFTLQGCYNALMPDKITNEEIIKRLEKSINKIKTHSKILLDIFSLNMPRSNYPFLENDQSFFEALCKSHPKKFFRDYGILVQGEEVLIHCKRGINFIRELFRKSGQTVTEATLANDLKDDGELFKNYQFKRIEKHGVPINGYYYCFKWKEVQALLGGKDEGFYQEAETLPDTSHQIYNQ